MFVNFGVKEASYCLSFLAELRSQGISSELYPDAEKMKKQMNYANNKRVKYVVLVGENEIKTGMLSIKDMDTGEQSNMNIDSLINNILDG